MSGHDFVSVDQHEMFPQDWHDGDERIVAWFCLDCDIITLMPERARNRGAVCPGCRHGNLKPIGYAFIMPMHVHDREHKSFTRIGDL